MMKKLILGIAAVVLTIPLILISHGCSGKPSKKFAVILQAGKESHEGMARALHAMLYSKELKEKGYDVVLIFDGAGTEWAEALMDEKNKLSPVFQQVQSLGIVQVVCDYCSTAFKVKAPLQKKGAHFEGDYGGHPSIAKWVDQGYQLVVL